MLRRLVRGGEELSEGRVALFLAEQVSEMVAKDYTTGKVLWHTRKEVLLRSDMGGSPGDNLSR